MNWPAKALERLCSDKWEWSSGHWFHTKPIIDTLQREPDLVISWNDMQEDFDLIQQFILWIKQSFRNIIWRTKKWELDAHNIEFIIQLKIDNRKISQLYVDFINKQLEPLLSRKIWWFNNRIFPWYGHYKTIVIRSNILSIPVRLVKFNNYVDEEHLLITDETIDMTPLFVRAFREINPKAVISILIDEIDKYKTFAKWLEKKLVIFDTWENALDDIHISAQERILILRLIKDVLKHKDLTMCRKIHRKHPHFLTTGEKILDVFQ